jgi:hypothetical protein
MLKPLPARVAAAAAARGREGSMPDQKRFTAKASPISDRGLAEQILRSSTKAEAAALAAYFEQLLTIRRSSMSVQEKLRLAVNQTIDGKLILPLFTVIAREVQAIWGRVSLPAQFGIMAGAAALAAFGRAGAGIATLGTAVGVPLWIVAGSGGALAGTFLELFHARSQLPPHDDIVDAEFVVVGEGDQRQAARSELKL